MSELLHDYRELQINTISKTLLDELGQFSECDIEGPWIEYSNFELTQEKAEQLEKIIELNLMGEFEDEEAGNNFWAPVHAWRILATKNYVHTIPLLIERLVIVLDDDFAQIDIPKALVKFGSSAIDPIISEFKKNTIQPNEVFNFAALLEVLKEIAEKNPLEQNKIVDFLIEELSDFDSKSPVLNAFLVITLVELNDIRAKNIIIKAFEYQYIDEDVVNWRYVKNYFTVATDLPEKITVSEYLSYFFDYSGDDKFQKMLNALGSNSNVECVKFFSLGYILSTASIIPERIFSELLVDDEGEEVIFYSEGQAKIVYHEFSSLIKLLSTFQDKFYAFPNIDIDDESLSPDWLMDVKLHRARQYLEHFLDGFNLENKAIERQIGSNVSEFIDSILMSIEEIDEMVNFDLDSETKSIQDKVLLFNKMTNHWNENYRNFAKETANYRQNLIERAKFVEKFKNIGRNDPCPCGSGKRFKKCCLMSH